MKKIVEFIASETNSDPHAISVGLIALSSSFVALMLVESSA